MKYNMILHAIVLIVYLFLGAGCSFGSKTDKIEEISIVNFEQLEPEFTKTDDVLYVVNFWATWCAPCVKELPDFMAVNSEFSNSDDFRMILVSLDDSDNLEGPVKKFIEDKNLKGVELYLLDDIKRMNEWIPAIDSSWSGSIPATLFIKNGKSLKFVPGAIEKDELRKIILELKI